MAKIIAVIIVLVLMSGCSMRKGLIKQAFEAGYQKGYWDCVNDYIKE